MCTVCVTGWIVCYTLVVPLKYNPTRLDCFLISLFLLYVASTSLRTNKTPPLPLSSTSVVGSITNSSSGIDCSVSHPCKPSLACITSIDLIWRSECRYIELDIQPIFAITVVTINASHGSASDRFMSE